MAASPTSNDGKTVDKYQLGDSLGKGAFGQVYRALNFTTGEVVAVKQIQLTAIPKSEIGDIMSEIDLLKNLNHANIVKYKGFVKTREFLYIILEYCENGSLHNICKKFGKFPENLVAVYISQVLEGLVYLHDQGVIHRDIKGANILTNKDGCVKLADFGVASNTAAANADDGAVVGSPYWMAPEVIEQSGATTASDIWSVGCVVIELLEGKPPYHFLDPMPALFRIVQDDCPPIPEGASHIVKDFLYHCFQKDANLRVSAKKLLKHSWMVSARKHMHAKTPDPAQTGGPVNLRAPNYNFDEAVLKFFERADRSLTMPTAPTRTMKNGTPRGKPSAYTVRPGSPSPSSLDIYAPSSLGSAGMGWKMPASNMKPTGAPLGPSERARELPVAPPMPEEQTDNWDDDFEGGISITKIHALEKTTIEEDKDDKQEQDWNAQTIKPTHRSPSGVSYRSLTSSPQSAITPIVEDYSDIAGEEDEGLLMEKVANFKIKNSSKRGLFHPSDIKTVGLTSDSSIPKSAPPSSVSTVSSVSTPSILSTPSVASKPNETRRSPPSLQDLPSRPSSHSRSTSFAGGSSTRSDGKRTPSQAELQRYTENEEEDYEEIFGKPNAFSSEQPMQTLQLNTRLSNKSWLGDDDDNEEDPFAEIDEGFVEDDLETNLNRDKHARLCASVNQLIDELVPKAPDFNLRDTCDQLIAIIADAPEMQMQLVSSHGMLAILEILESKPSREVALKLLQIVNLLVTADIGFLESFCLIGGIPVMMGFTSKKYSAESRIEASNFVRLLCHTSVLTLQMFIACRGLKVLVDLLDEDYVNQTDLVTRALDGIGSVFELQSPTPKNDFCRMFIREGLLDPLSSALVNIMTAAGEAAHEMRSKIIQIILVFSQVSQSDVHVRTAMGTRQVVRRLLRACELLEPEHLIHMLKAIKHLSMSANLLDVLQNSNSIDILVRLLDEHGTGPHGTEMSNHIFHTCYNLCRLNKSRQEEAAQAGIITHLKRVIDSASPLKQFALPIFCDLASATKSCRTLLWHHDGLHVYIVLLDDPYFQVSALEAILSWLQDETARVEDDLSKPEALEAIMKCFVTAKANSFENLLDPLLKIFKLSHEVTTGVASRSRFIKRLLDRLSHHNKAVVRLNLLRILRAVCDAHPDRSSIVEKYGILAIVERLSRQDGAILMIPAIKTRSPLLPTTPTLSTPASSIGLGKAPGNGNPPRGGGLAPKPRGMRRMASEASMSLEGKASLDHNPTTPAPSRPALKVRRTSRAKLGDIAWRDR
ncbi:hypothetical protein SISNIDRAFT_475331 [Sistotremastrum niveocremeum HHB9708]|uniref:non-specific serine/threonine protein kinase n=1 Tax=Sistotremastrum niveocremeum HHB9708 TaxID=1314777 RepID=A0A164RED2_9AGAM|nr:hypothetical protein SISNIDRAFT_475331 [Sistotremastrum niveocremeum HHB9708]